LAVRELEEHTISCGRLLDYCCSKTDPPYVLLSQLSDCYFEEVGDEFDFRAGDPDVARTRAGAASAATEALEMQASGIPRGLLFNHGFHGLTRISKMFISHKKAEKNHRESTRIYSDADLHGVMLVCLTNSQGF
jgi:hypothetical protein